MGTCTLDSGAETLQTAGESNSTGQSAYNSLTAILIEQALAGDGAAFAALVQPHLRLFTAGIQRILLNVQDTQDTLEKALWNIRTALPGLAESRQFPVWAYRICLNQALSRRRSRVPPLTS